MPLPESNDKWLIAHAEDLSKQAASGGYMTVSDFLDERQQGLLSHLDGRLSSCIWFYGGDEQCERKAAFFYPDYLEENRLEMAKEELCLISIRPADSRFISKELTHRDYLGSLMGLGIKREKIGDIRLSDEGAFVVVKAEIASFICQEITSVGRIIVQAKTTALEALPPAPGGVLSLISVSSLRLDALVSRGFNAGRTEAAKWINGGIVSKNGVITTSADKQAAIGDRITVSGRGRMVLVEYKGVSRSGRKQILIERFGK